MPFHSADVTAEASGTDGFLSWAYPDRRDGTVVVGSANMSAPSDTASMVKAWIAPTTCAGRPSAGPRRRTPTRPISRR
jgi:hypothetical protein